MPTIKEEIARASDWLSSALLSSGYNADYSLNSLSEVERFYNDHTANGFARPNSFIAHETEERMFAMGCYIGEVIRRAKGGEWRGSDQDPDVKINLELRMADGSICWPTQRAMKRLKNGSVDSVVEYAQSFGAALGGKSPKKSLFKRIFG